MEGGRGAHSPTHRPGGVLVVLWRDRANVFKVMTLGSYLLQEVQLRVGIRESRTVTHVGLFPSTEGNE